MRIIALPLARAKVSPDARLRSTANTLLVFYHFDLISPFAERREPLWHQKLLKSATNKATRLWDSLGKAPKGSWKLWTYELGERMVDRVEFEELALGSVDPSLGPTISTRASTKEVNDVIKDPSQIHSIPKIPLIYPPSLYPAGADHALHPSLAHLRTLLANHVPRHRRGFVLWLLIAPFTIPFALIPLIPNLPLFFCAWRSWTHYKAYRSSQYLSSLINRGLIEPNPSLELDKLYTSFTSSRTSSSPLPPAFTSRSPGKTETSAFTNAAVDRKSEIISAREASRSKCILLTVEAMPQILEMFGLPESTRKDIHRAMNQVHDRLEKSP